MDLINREALVEELNELYGNQTVSKYSYSRDCKKARFGIVLAINKVKTAPTVDAELVRYGKWEFDVYTGKPFCTQCGHEPYRKNNKELPNYCPNCGAKMEGYQ